MITRTRKASASLLARIAITALQDETYRNQFFPQCQSTNELVAELKTSRREWNLLVTDHPIALFTLNLSDKTALIENVLATTSSDVSTAADAFRHEFETMKVESLTLRVPEFMVESLASRGFEKRTILVRLIGPVVETKLMPILPLSNPTERDLPHLAGLMHDSYEKGLEPKLSSVVDAEKELRQIMKGTFGDYVAEASFISGATRNFVSACFVTLAAKGEAQIAELFTHPLYRARGLATIEVVTSMNRLSKLAVDTLTVWVGERNDVALRLFAKLGFKQDRKVVEMTLGRLRAD